MSELVLAALNGSMGSRSYYVAVVPLREIASRVKFATEIHKSRKLSDFIQRRFNKTRTKKIADYLISNDDRFFGSLVVAVYGGEPLWFDAGDITFAEHVQPRPTLPENLEDRIGFLMFNGKETLFALDGQHRLSGIKRAVGEYEPLNDELVSVIFVGHEQSAKGLVRTRRLFTDLNKHAKTIAPADRIALDEDDASAIITRTLVDDDNLFFGETVSFTASNNIAPEDQKSLITILGLYEAVKIVVNQLPHQYADQMKLSANRNQRPSESDLDGMKDVVSNFFQEMIRSFADLDSYFKSSPDKRSAKKWRSKSGGNVLFRPVGFLIFVRLIVELVATGHSLKQAMAKTNALPVLLSHQPYRNVLWMPETRTMNGKRKTVVLDLLRVALGLAIKKERAKVIANTLNDAHSYSPDSEDFLSSEDIGTYVSSFTNRG